MARNINNYIRMKHTYLYFFDDMSDDCLKRVKEKIDRFGDGKVCNCLLYKQTSSLAKLNIEDYIVPYDD